MELRSNTFQEKYDQILMINIESLNNILTSKNPSQHNESLLVTSLDQFSSTLEEIKSKNIDITTIITNSIISQFIDNLSFWILKNFKSHHLTSILNIISSVLLCYGYTENIPQKEINTFIECESLDKIKENENKQDELIGENYLSNNSIITYQFLNMIYSITATISNKPDIIIKSRNLVKIILIISSQIVEIDFIANYFKHKRLISALVNILKVLLKSSSEKTKESLIVVTRIEMKIFSKIGMRRTAYRDYMFRKSIPTYISDIVIKDKEENIELIKEFSVYIIFSCRNKDHKIFFWTKGIIKIFFEIMEKKFNDKELIENMSLSICFLAKGCDEIQEDLFSLNYLTLAKKLLVTYSASTNIILFIISTLRRIKNDKFYEKMSQELLFTFFTLFDYYYLDSKKEFNKIKIENKNINLLTQPKFTILKELIAILGNIIKNEEHAKPFLDKNYHVALIDIILTFINFPKLIKNTIGALVNLTNISEIRESFGKVAAFINAVYLIFDEYKENKFIIDYLLKLICNLLKSETIINIFITGNIMYYLILFIYEYKNEENIIINSIKILRILLTKVKGLEEFLTKISEFYTEIYKSNNEEKIKCYSSFINDLIKFLECNNYNIESKIEIISLIAYLANQKEELKNIIQNNKEIIHILNNLVNFYLNNEESSQSISQAIAQLPIEDLNID